MPQFHKCICQEPKYVPSLPGKVPKNLYICFYILNKETDLPMQKAEAGSMFLWPAERPALDLHWLGKI